MNESAILSQNDKAQEKLHNYAIVMPVYNEAASIKSVIEENYHHIILKLDDAVFVICEDGSTDGTKTVLTSIEKEKKIPLYLFMDNSRKGYVKAVKDAINIAARKAKYLIFLDSDGQYYPEDFWKLYKHIGDADIIMGQRINRSEPWYRKILSKGINILAKILFGVKCKDLTSAFRIMDANTAKHIANAVKYSKYNFWSEFTVRANTYNIRMKEEPIRYRERKNGITQVYKPSKIPKIVLNELSALIRTFLELKFKEVGKFAIVGASGTGIILSLLWFLTELIGFNYMYSAAISIESSILWAFLLNDKFTFKNKTTSKLSRFIKYHIISLASMGLNLLVLFSLTTIGIHYMISEVLAIITAFISNYILNVRWTWK